MNTVYKLKIPTLALLAVFIAVIMSACVKDEPSVSMEITTEVGNSVSQYPYGYAEATITFACSEDYLELSIPSFAIVSKTNAELVTPAREDFKLADEKSTVSLVEKGDIVKREMPVYTYSFKVTLKESDGACAAFALNTLKDNFEENIEKNIEIYRGYHDIDIRVYCPDGQFATSNASNLYNIFGYKSEGNKVETLLNLYQLHVQVPTLALEYKSSATGNSLPDFNISATDLPYSEVMEFFNGLMPPVNPNGSYSYDLSKANRNEIINKVGEHMKKSDGISLDVLSEIKKYLYKQTL